jgi:imidazoleglycerol phosphate dehydratase HisB
MFNVIVGTMEQAEVYKTPAHKTIKKALQDALKTAKTNNITSSRIRIGVQEDGEDVFWSFADTLEAAIKSAQEMDTKSAKGNGR